VNKRLLSFFLILAGMSLACSLVAPAKPAEKPPAGENALPADSAQVAARLPGLSAPAEPPPSPGGAVLRQLASADPALDALAGAAAMIDAARALLADAQIQSARAQEELLAELEAITARLDAEPQP